MRPDGRTTAPAKTARLTDSKQSSWCWLTIKTLAHIFKATGKTVSLSFHIFQAFLSPKQTDCLAVSVELSGGVCVCRGCRALEAAFPLREPAPRSWSKTRSWHRLLPASVDRRLRLNWIMNPPIAERTHTNTQKINLDKYEESADVQDNCCHRLLHEYSITVWDSSYGRPSTPKWMNFGKFS